MERWHSKIDIVVLSMGPAATVVAAELACMGIQALDVGQFGGVFDKYVQTHPGAGKGCYGKEACAQKGVF